MFSIRMMSYLGGSDLFITLSNTVWSGNEVTWSGVELLWSEKELITKVRNVRLANSKAGIKPTAPLSAFDKENSIEFPLDLVHYIYMQSNPNPVLLSHTSL